MLRYFIIISDFTLIALIVCCMRSLRWRYEQERSSLIGFGCMVVILLLNIGLLFSP